MTHSLGTIEWNADCDVKVDYEIDISMTLRQVTFYILL